jgi:hypothetical protein
MFRIREATREDNDALLHLEAQSPQGTGISIIIDRDDYFYRSRLHEHTRVLIAEENEKLVGIMAYAIKDVYIDGQKDRAAYFYDLRGEATYRRSMKRGLFRLWRTASEAMEAAGASFIYGHVKADNHASMSVSTKVGACPVASFHVLSLPSIRGSWPELDPHLDTLDEEVERIRALTGTRNLAPIDFPVAYRRGAELGYLSGIYRIESGGSSAQVSAWNLSGIYRTRVLHMPVSLRLLGWVLNPLSSVFPVPRVPRAGESMTYLQLFDPVCHGPKATALLRRLIQYLRHKAYADGIDIVTLFVYADDPLGPLPRFFPQKVLQYHTMARPLCKQDLPNRPLYLDIRDI